MDGHEPKRLFADARQTVTDGLFAGQLPRWPRERQLRRRIRRRAHELAGIAYQASLLKMLEQYASGELNVNLIEWWTPHAK